ncbi:MAG: glycosyltransferase [Saprospiraceae bacterium]
MDIVCIGLPAWEGNYQKSTLLLVSELAKKHNVLYVEYPFTVKDFIFNKQAPKRRMLQSKNGLRKLNLQNGALVNVLTLPPILPANGLKNERLYEAVMDINAALVLPRIKKAISSCQMENPTVINAFNPFLGIPLAGKLNESKLIYYCYDDMASADWIRLHGTRLEKKMMEISDAVIFSSETLRDKNEAYNSNSFVVKNGVDFDLFSKGFKAEQAREVKIGYLGSIDNRIDYELLIYSITKHPDWTFEFTGRKMNGGGWEQIKGFPNVIFKEPVGSDMLPQVISTYSVGIIPFVKNEFTNCIYPLKINEYLAAGLPAVSTDFGDLNDFREIASIESSPEGFENALVQAVFNDDKNKKQKRQEIAGQNTWKARADEFEAAIKNCKKQAEKIHDFSKVLWNEPQKLPYPILLKNGKILGQKTESSANSNEFQWSWSI